MVSASASTGWPPVANGVFHHEAFLYAGPRDFLDGTMPFVLDGLSRQEPTLVMLNAARGEAMRGELGGDADRVMFADMAQVGRNPARIIPHWQRFVTEHRRPDRPVRGVCEPVHAGRRPAELVECQGMERLLNLAFADSAGWTLLCPYDTRTLASAVVDEAYRSHPFVTRDGARQRSEQYPASRPPAGLDAPLPPAPADATPAVAFGPGVDGLATVRALVARHAARAGLDPTATDNLLLAANELASNSLQHGGGRGTIQLWCEDTTVVCQVCDTGHITDQPLLGQQLPTPTQTRGRGLWLANQLCDLVQIRSAPSGTTVRLHIDRAVPGH